MRLEKKISDYRIILLDATYRKDLSEGISEYEKKGKFPLRFKQIDAPYYKAFLYLLQQPEGIYGIQLSQGNMPTEYKGEFSKKVRLSVWGKEKCDSITNDIVSVIGLEERDIPLRELEEQLDASMLAAFLGKKPSWMR